jgi:hypothetical protein
MYYRDYPDFHLQVNYLGMTIAQAPAVSGPFTTLGEASVRVFPTPIDDGHVAVDLVSGLSDLFDSLLAP